MCSVQSHRSDQIQSLKNNLVCKSVVYYLGIILAYFRLGGSFLKKANQTSKEDTQQDPPFN